MMRLALVLCFAFLPALSWAGEITATHRVVGMVDTVDGPATALDITVTNGDVASLTGVTLEPMGPMPMLLPGNGLTLPGLAAGQSVTARWEIVSPMPLFPGMPLHLMGTGTDGAGALVTFGLVSVAEAVQ